jgi:hypothetical protein
VEVGVRVCIEVEKFMKEVRLEGRSFVGSYEVQSRLACCRTTRPLFCDRVIGKSRKIDIVDCSEIY